MPNVEENEQTQKDLQDKIAHVVGELKKTESKLFLAPNGVLEKLENIFVKKREQTLIYPCASYRESLPAANLSSLVKGQSAIISAKLFADVISKDHKATSSSTPTKYMR